jgi:arylsulfatase A-like enzyme
MDQPNILIFMTDQQRGGTLLGDRRAQLPNVEALAARGVRFTNARCPAPHCCPSRATFHTGLYPSQHGVWNNVLVPNALSRGLNPGVRTWGEDLASTGYRCAWAGKWHIDDSSGPRDHGWEELVVNQGPDHAPSDQRFADWVRRQGGQQTVTGPERIVRPGWPPCRMYGVHERFYDDEEMVGTAVNWLRQRRDDASQPWCLFVGTQGPHDPYQVPQRFLDLYPAEEPSPSCDDAMLDRPGMYRRLRRLFGQLGPAEQREAARHYKALCSYEDWLFGNVMRTLTEIGQCENTIVIFTSDHGEYLGDHGLWTKGLPAFIGAYDVPLVMAGPGIAQGVAVDAFVGHEDVAATIWETAGLPGRGTGASLRPWLVGERPAWRDAWFTQCNGNEQYGIQRIVGERDWLYVYNGYDEDELYDLRADPHQLRNLAADPVHAAQRDRLCTRMWRFAIEHSDIFANGYIMSGLAPVGPGVATTP